MPNHHFIELDNKEKFQQIQYHVLESMPDLVRLIDLDGKILYANRAMNNFSGFDVVGQVCPFDADSHQTGIPNCIPIKRFFKRAFVTEERKIGNRTFSIKSSPVYDQGRNMVGAVEVFRDITSETNARISLIQANIKMRNDLIFARKIQQQLLPAKGDYGAIRFDYRYITSEQLSGDFFDVIHIDDDHIGVYISDIMGHGITASILTMFVHQTMRSIVSVENHLSPAEVLSILRKRFGALHLGEDKYLTIFYGVYHIKNQDFHYANAGHIAVPIMYNHQRMKMLCSKGVPISLMFADQEYVENSIHLEAGDKILFYTDGITETKNHEREEFGQERLFDLIRNNKSGILNDIVEKVERFRWSEMLDDIALLLMEVL